MKKKRDSRRLSFGIALLQTMVAMGVITIIGLKILEGIGESRMLIGRASRMDAATLYARSELEWLRVKDVGALPLGVERPFGCGLEMPSELVAGEAHRTVEEVRPGLFRAEVAVTWRDRLNHPREVRLETFLYGEAERSER